MAAIRQAVRRNDSQTIDQQREAFVAEVLKKAPVTEATDAFRTNAVQKQDLLACNIFRVCFDSGLPNSCFIEHLANAYASIERVDKFEFRHPETKRLLDPSQAAQWFQDKCVELCRQQKEISEGRVGAKTVA